MGFFLWIFWVFWFQLLSVYLGLWIRKNKSSNACFLYCSNYIFSSFWILPFCAGMSSGLCLANWLWQPTTAKPGLTVPYGFVFPLIPPTFSEWVVMDALVGNQLLVWQCWVIEHMDVWTEAQLAKSQFLLVALFFFSDFRMEWTGWHFSINTNFMEFFVMTWA